MEFKKFSSLENTYRQATIDKIIYELLDQGDWVATEKVHGANFSFWFDGSELRVASRTQFVDGTFYGCQPVIDRYTQTIKDRYKALGGNSFVTARVQQYLHDWEVSQEDKHI